MKQTILSVILYISLMTANAQQISKSFELRHFTSDQNANGQTDFRGGDEWLDTEERIEFLNDYVTYGKHFYQVPGLDKMPITDKEANTLLKKLKPQPQPKVRRRLNLTTCKWIGYQDGLTTQKQKSIDRWVMQKGVAIEDGKLVFSKNSSAAIPFNESLNRYYKWRYHLEWDVIIGGKISEIKFALMGGKLPVIEVGITSNNECFYTSNGKKVNVEYVFKANETYRFKLEVDHESKKYNLLINGVLVADFVALNNEQTPNMLSILASKDMVVDNIWGLGFANQVTMKDVPDVNKITKHLRPAMYPYLVKTFIDEQFQLPVTPENWTDTDYDDGQWNDGELPLAYGSERHKGESLYIRHKVIIEDFEKATLNIESLSPAGEIWVNGTMVELCKNNSPRSIDISLYLNKNEENIVAFRVYPYKLKFKDYMTHSITDRNIGWFLGRAYIDLHHSLSVSDVFVYTKSVGNTAKIHWEAILNNSGETDYSNSRYLEGQARISLTPWFPEESDEVAVTETKTFLIPWKQQKIISGELTLPSPKLWSYKTPNLYKVKVELLLKDGTLIDDYVTTSGIRTVSQEGGTFRINGKPEMLNGALLFGFRAPIANLTKDLYCPEAAEIVKDVMQIKRMNGNSIRMSVHDSYYGGTNDPRYAEIADQLGVMMIWTTSEFIRERSPWTVSSDQLQEDIKLVRNHPSIVIWQPGNHVWYANAESALDWYDKIFETILPVDPSRLINPCALQHNELLMALNNEGTKMAQKDSSWVDVKPHKSWTSPLHAQGSMVGVLAYGMDWMTLSRLETHYTHNGAYAWEQLLKEKLNHPYQAFINYESQEIIGQPNWNLVKGQPWYKIHSYEHGYDEGSIGRKLEVEEWQTSQAWQAFAGYEITKKMRLLDFDGNQWCPLRGGGNTVTYKKPLIDYSGHAKLSYYAYSSILQETVATSDNVDIVYGPDDKINPVILNIGERKVVNLFVNIRQPDGLLVFTKMYENVELPSGRTQTHLPGFIPELIRGDNIRFSGNCPVEYVIEEIR